MMMHNGKNSTSFALQSIVTIRPITLNVVEMIDRRDFSYNVPTRLHCLGWIFPTKTAHKANQHRVQMKRWG